MKLATMFLSTLLFLTACDHSQALVVPGPDESWVYVDAERALRDKVDILFLIDDSRSMAPKQAILKQRFADLATKLQAGATEGLPASYHIGVVTSDLGAPGVTCGKNRHAQLQQKGAAAVDCEGPAGLNYLVYDQKNPENDNLPAGQDLAKTFGCMAAVGDSGCGFEMQLEAVYLALHDPIAENQGFLREDATLAIVFVTDEDDCSIDNFASDVFGPNTSQYGPLTSFRCTRFGLVCDGTFPLPGTPSSFASCRPATTADGSKLASVDKYVNYFTRPRSEGGIKADPFDVVLATVSGPTTTIASDTTTNEEICGKGSSSCTELSHSCSSTAAVNFVADPAVRLTEVVNAAHNHHVSSICEDSYANALDVLGDQILDAIKSPCLKQPIRYLDATETRPNCVAEEVRVASGAPVRTTIPLCADVGGATPCYRVTERADCVAVCDPASHTKRRTSIVIDRGGVELPEGVEQHIRCQGYPIGQSTTGCP